MFKTKTTIIVGAGASAELGLPVGEGLMGQIKDLLRTSDRHEYGFVNELVARAVRQKVGDGSDGGWTASQRWRDAARKITTGLDYHQSIDNLLHFLRDDDDAKALGKLAIAMCIADDEQRSYFFRDGPLAAVENPKAPRLTKGGRDSWYVPLGRKLLAEHDRANMSRIFDNVTFVVFNYDRCLEQYLGMMIEATCELRPGETLAGIIPRHRFIHPYGSLGPLPWQAAAGETSMGLGQGDDVDYWEVSRNIRTFTESVESQIADDITAAVRSAETLMLLGFGYNDQNVALLNPGPGRYAQRAIATAYQKAGDEELSVRSVISGLVASGSPRIIVDPGTCREMFDRLQVTLNAA